MKLKDMPIPPYIRAIAVFQDDLLLKNCLLGMRGGEVWLFTWEGDAWVSYRRATKRDLELIKAAAGPEGWSKGCEEKFKNWESTL